MRKLLLMVFLPVALFALERVNLIKDAGFEKNKGVWYNYTWVEESYYNDSAIANSHDPEKAYSGSYSGSCDTRKDPGNVNQYGSNRAVIIQGFSYPKTLKDIDSLFFRYCVFPVGNDFLKTCVMFTALYINVGKPNSMIAGYCNKPPDYPFLNPSLPVKYLEQNVYTEDTLWMYSTKDIRKKLENIAVESNATIDSITLWSGGTNDIPWRGQKIYFDDIRLTGYADYDVGIKGFVSKDSVWKDTGYTPTARIKNFGRKAADSFLVIAQIEGGSGVIYADTLSRSLVADTEDTVSFKEFKPSDASNYTLTVSTIMTPDESDEDDAVSKTLYGTGVEEQSIPAGLVFHVSSFASIPQVSYVLPLGEQGTISLYDPAGRRIESIRVHGEGEVSFKSELSSGVYFVKLETEKTSVTRKAVILN